MRVTHVEENITHAIIGGMTAIDFGISDNPEFFHILSSTLYKNQKLAVVRETLCNAWDAHIEGNKTDLPIKITLNQEELVIEDFGIGIAHELIGSVYGTYGNSTKKNDGRATGGFGLGCKAPFAYTDNFEVVSCHGGVGTIYSLSKSNAEVGGKPGIIPITNYKTDNVGLKVTIPLKDKDDQYSFHQLIMKIVKEGGIKAEYSYMDRDYEVIETVPFENMKENYLISDTRIHDDTNIMVRYGNVIYPVSVHSDYADSYDEISKFLAALSGITRRSSYDNQYRNRSDWTIIFQAEPNTLTITPSREELSMQDMTVKTLTGILQEFVKTLRKKVNNAVMPTLVKAINNCISIWNLTEIFGNIGNLPSTTYGRGGAGSYYGSVGQIIHAFVKHNYPTGNEQRYLELNARINGLLKAGYCNKSQLFAFKKYLKQNRNSKNGYGIAYMSGPEFYKIFVKDIHKALTKGSLPTDRFMMYQDAKNRSTRYSYSTLLQPLEDMKIIETDKAFNFLAKTVILSYNKADIDEYLHGTEFHRFFGSKERSFVYLVSKNEKERNAVRKLFYDKGYVVFDLTHKYEEEQERVHALKVARERIQAAKEARMELVPPPVVGIRTLSSYLENDESTTPYIDVLMAEDDLNPSRIEDPECVIRLFTNRTNHSSCISGSLGNSNMGHIAKLFGDRIGVCETTSKYERILEKGVKPLETFLYGIFAEAFTKDDNFKNHIALEAKQFEGRLTRNQIALLRFIRTDPVLSKIYGVHAPLTTKESKLYALWTKLRDCYAFTKHAKSLEKFNCSVIQNQCMTALIEKIMNSSNWELINVSILPDLSLQSEKGKYLYSSTHPRVELARKMILLILKG